MAHQTIFSKFIRIKQKKHPKVTLDDIIAFFQQLSTLLNSGVPLLHALRLSAEQTESDKLSKALSDISNKVAGGVSFYDALNDYPKIFKSHWNMIIHTGEITGQLGSLVDKLSTYIREVRKTQGKVTSAMIYPSILMSVAVLATVIMLWKVVPTFAAFFQDFGMKLPAITQIVINVSNILTTKMPYVMGGVITLGFFFRYYVRTPDGKRNFSSALLALPIFGDLLIQSAMEKFATNFALLVKSGTPLLESIKTCQEVFRDNPVYFESLGDIHSAVSRGEKLGDSMANANIFTSMLVNMTKMGEESGKISDVLEQASVYYKDKIETTISRITGLIEPLIVIGMGVVFAGLMGSIYIPMFQMAGGAK